MPFTLSNTAVKIFRHAVSLDEHRAKFKPVHWHAPNQNHPKTSKTPTGEFPKTNYEGIFAEHLEDEKGVEGKERGTDIDEVRLTFTRVSEDLGTSLNMLSRVGMVCWMSLWYVFSIAF